MREIRLDLADIKQELPREVIEEMRKGVSSVNAYPSNYGTLERKFSDYLGVEPDQVVFSNGLDEMIELVTAAWGGRNIIPVPTFSQFSAAAERRNQKVISRNMMENGQYNLDLQDEDFNSDIIWICSPNNPTGDIMSRKQIRDIAERSRGIVVVDECYAEFAGESNVSLIENYDNLVFLRSFSKSFGLAGLRLGAAVSNKENIKKIKEFKQPFNVNKMAVIAGIAALENIGSYRGIWETVLETGKEFSAFLEGRGFSTGKINGNFLLADFGDEATSRKYYRGLSDLNVSVFPGWDEEFSGLEGRFLRFTIGTPEQMKEVESRFKILERRFEQREGR